MPLVTSKYRAPLLLSNPHLQTILPAILRQVSGISFRRERVPTPDDDFLDVDLLTSSSKRIALLVHGLEASTDSGYIRGMAKKLYGEGWLVAAMNLRGITHAPYELHSTYHSGATHDVNTVVNFLLQKFPCDEMVLIGFSLGGNQVIKYAGENEFQLDSRIKKAIGISVPCDLKATARNLDSTKKFYGRIFLRSLKSRVKLFHERLPFPLAAKDIDQIETLEEYDDVYTAPMFGFKNAEDYYDRCSAKKFIGGVKIPLLILSAKDDPFFTAE
ncbi:MAG: YheT family hydrolase, partial [Chitinophagales bacterium]